MATLDDGERAITLDRDRVLRMDFNALSEAESLTGRNFMTAETWRTMNARDYRALTFACLRHEDADLTIEMVGKMMTPKQERVITDALLALYIGETAEPVDDEETAKAPFGTAGASGGR